MSLITLLSQLDGTDMEQARVMLAGRPLADDMRHLDRSERSGETQ